MERIIFMFLWPSLGDKTGIEGFRYGFFVKITTDEDDLVHAVSIFLIPIPLESGFTGHEYLEVFLRSRGIPVASFRDFLLHSCLLEEYRHVSVMAEV